MVLTGFQMAALPIMIFATIVLLKLVENKYTATALAIISSGGLFIIATILPTFLAELHLH